MCVALCIVLLDSGEVNGTSRADPTLPHHYTAPGSNYKPVKFVTRPIYSQQQEIMKQSLHLQLLFNNITREKWQFVKSDPAQEESWVDIAPSSRTGHPLLALASLSSSSRTQHQHEAKLCNSDCFSRTRRSSSVAVLSFLPALVPATPGENFGLEIPASFKSHHHHTQTSFKDMCNPTDRPCYALVFSFLIIVDPPETWKTK